MAETDGIKGLTGHKGLPCLRSRVSARLRHVPRVGFASPAGAGVTVAKIDGPSEPVYSARTSPHRPELELPTV